MCRSTAILIFLVALVPLIAGRAQAQVAPGASTSSGGTNAAASGSIYSSGTSGLAGGPSPQGSFLGSVPGKLEPGVVQLSLQDAISRGLRQNLGLLLAGQDVRSSRGERWRQLSALLPNVNTSSYVADSQVDLAEFGFSFRLPGVTIPSVVGPFSYIDSRASVTQNIFDWKAINNTHAASEEAKSAQHTYKDARDLVTLAVGYEYLQAIANEARIDTADAQLKTAQSLYDQASDQVKAGTSPAIDGLRAQVEMKTRQQQLIQARNDFAIQKLTLARVIGFAPGQQFELTDKSPYQPFLGITLEAALKQAYDSRSDFKAASEDVRAAEYSRKAAEAGYLPSLSVSADYGLAGTVPQLSTHGVFDVRGTLAIPIFQGGKVHGDVLEADARLEKSREHLEDLRGQIDQEVRTALLNVESAEEEVAVAQSNIALADQTLAQSRDRFQAGVTDTVEVVQAQETVAGAHENYISSLYRDNYAKISLARALGVAEEGVKEYFKGK
ncbi:MAG TPA: TolC family protein [Candidatus Acidoferrales bacterium]|nr:TolC family protein [Candidatus Acidoferrales bacterium]